MASNADYNSGSNPASNAEYGGILERIEKKVDTMARGKTKSKDFDDEDSVSGDENKSRGNWSGKLDFLLSCLGYAVGLGNVWRFPYLCFRNGGAVFLIPYAIMLFLVGMPIFVLELSLGQFTSQGPVTCWGFARMFSGIGWGMVVVSTLVAIYYNMIIGWAIYYFIASFTAFPGLPWDNCPSRDVGSKFCEDYVKDYGNQIHCESEGHDAFAGVCWQNGSNKEIPVGYYNNTLADETYAYKKVSASESYLQYVVWGRGYSENLEDFGIIRWQLVLCLLAAWVIVYFSLIKGIKSSGKVVYFTALFPYVVLVILLVRGLLLEGHEKGIEFYMTPKYERLADSAVWKDAAVQIFFSLSASWGGLIALASYNRFHNDCIRDSLIVSLGNCLTSFFAGFVIFSYIGHLATRLNVDVEDVAASGTGLAFVVYTDAVTTLPASPFWSIIFFLMLITLGLDSEFALVETILTSITDLFPSLRKKKWLVLAVLSAFLFLLGIPVCGNGGSYLLDLLDTYSGGWNVLLISLLECTAVGFVYGARRFSRDIGTMVGNDFCGFVPWFGCSWYWAIMWCFFTPILVTFVMMFSWLDYKPITYDDGDTPFETWAQVIGWLCTMVVVIAIFIPPIYHFITARGSFLERVQALMSPTVEWGPALTKHRRLVDYVENFITDLDDHDTISNVTGPNYRNFQGYSSKYGASMGLYGSAEGGLERTRYNPPPPPSLPPQPMPSYHNPAFEQELPSHTKGSDVSPKGTPSTTFGNGSHTPSLPLPPVEGGVDNPALDRDD